MATGETLAEWTVLANEPPASNYATFDARNAHPILAFDDTTAEGACFSAVLSRNYAGGGITVYLHWLAVATSGTGGWTVEFEAMADGGTDLDADSFAAAQTVTAATVPGTSGIVKVTNVAVANGAAMDSIAVGNAFRIRVKRDVATDTAVGDLQLLAIEMKET